MDARRHAPATSRNRDPILGVLRDVLPSNGLILEIASGSGEHTAFFASHFPDLTWQPSEADRALLPSISAWSEDAVAETGCANILPPIHLRSNDHPWPVDQADGILAINMVHISPWESCEGLMSGGGRVLGPDGMLLLYGPFIRNDVETAPSNLEFDRYLRQQNPLWGIRHLDDVSDLAAKNDLNLIQAVPMPANNVCVIFRKAG